MKFLFVLKITGKDKKEETPEEVATVNYEIDEYNITTIEDAEKEMVENLEDLEIKQYYKKRTNLEITVGIILAKITKD